MFESRETVERCAPSTLLTVFSLREDTWMHRKQKMVSVPWAPWIVCGGFVTLRWLWRTVALPPWRSPGAVQLSVRRSLSPVLSYHLLLNCEQRSQKGVWCPVLSPWSCFTVVQVLSGWVRVTNLSCCRRCSADWLVLLRFQRGGSGWRVLFARPCTPTRPALAYPCNPSGFFLKISL